MQYRYESSKLIDKQIAPYTDWRGGVMTKLRKLIHEADPNITEEWKWETGMWIDNGLVCAISAFKDHVKMNFFKGAQLKNKHKLLNSGLTSKNHRAIGFSEDDKMQEGKIKDLIKEAVGLNKA